MKTLFKLIIEIILLFLIEVGCAAIGWNLCLVHLFPDLEPFNFRGLCVLIIALNMLSLPFVSWGHIGDK